MRLPAGWAVTSVGEVLLGVESGKSEQTLERRPRGDDVGVIKVSAVTWGEFDPAEAKAVHPNRFDQARSIRNGDLLFSRANTVELAGAVVHVKQDHPRLMLSDKILRLLVAEEVPPRYLMFALRTVRSRRHLEGSATGTSTSMRNITQENLRVTPLPLAPSTEQRRIVAKLDAVFEQTRAAKARLERLPALLDKLKRSILAAAFRGDLTKDWRAAQPDVEPASVLLDRIRAERRQRWEDAVRAKGKDPARATYEEGAQLDMDGLAALPDGWVWASLDEVATSIRNGVSPRPEESPPGVPVLRISSVRPMKVDLDERRYLRDVGEFEEFHLLDGDVLFTRYNGTLELVGVCGVVQGCDGNLVYPDKLIRVRTLVSPHIVALSAHTDSSRRQIEGWAKSSAGQTGISGADLRCLPIPVPPSEEAKVLVQVVAQAFAGIESLLAHARELSSRLKRLEQAALAKAFRGELVPQDPTDEPASILLERIRAARGAEPERPRRGRNARKRAAHPATSACTSPGNSHASAAQHVDLVVAAFQQDSRLTAAAIGKATGLDASAVKQALADLVDGGLVRVEGKARGTNYVWTA